MYTNMADRKLAYANTTPTAEGLIRPSAVGVANYPSAILVYMCMCNLSYNLYIAMRIL